MVAPRKASKPLTPSSQRPIHPLADRRLVAQVRLEHQPERAAGLVHEVEIHLDAAKHPVVVVAGALERLPHLPFEGVGMQVEQREVELELAREVLVEDRLADSGTLGDLVHRGCVVALSDEDFLGGAHVALGRLARDLQALRPHGLERVEIAGLDHFADEGEGGVGVLLEGGQLQGERVLGVLQQEAVGLGGVVGELARRRGELIVHRVHGGFLRGAGGIAGLCGAA